ncbi:MAG: ABC transporter substrate-binding protein [Firmicutes bacterium]|nr:ABC transporter substrate-binding protein [Bacillota bacterium]
MIKKTLCVLLSLMFALTACQKKAEENQAPQEEEIVDTTPEVITQSSIKVGGILPLSGDAASYGEAVKNGATLAAEEINAMNKPYTLELDIRDDRANVEDAVEIYNTLKQEQAQVILGPFTNSCAEQVRKTSPNDKLLHLLVSTTEEKLTGGKNKNVFRFCYNNKAKGEAAADYMLKNGITQAAILYESSDTYSKALKQAFSDRFKQGGGTVVVEEYFAKGDRDFKTQADRFKKYNFKAVFMPIYYTQAQEILLQFKKYGIETQYFGGEKWYGIVEQVEGNFGYIEGSKFLQTYLSEAQNQKNTDFVKKYKEKYGTAPDEYAACAYDAIYAVSLAAENCKDGYSGLKLAEEMAGIKVEGVTGTFSFKDGEIQKDTAFVTVEKGTYKCE